MLNRHFRQFVYLWLLFVGLTAGFAKSLEPLIVSQDQTGFVGRKTGTAFSPRGFNYDRDYKMRLLEEYWDQEWPTVREDFKEMKALGANVVRVHLQFGKFMVGPDKPNAAALRRFKQLLQVAEEVGLYLDITGLACYRKNEVPSWFNALSEQERWDAQATFWKAIAICGRKSPAVFCYDLMNEPVVPETRSSDWLVGQLAGFYYVQAITLDRQNRSREEIAREWTKKMCAAIRQVDKGHLITLGLLPNSADATGGSGFPPAIVAQELDFISVHLYPRSGKMEEDLATLRKFAVGKPLVIEETFPMGCSGRELKEFLMRAHGLACGWISFYWGQNKNELKEAKTIGAAFMLQSLDAFEQLNAKIPSGR